MRNHPMVNNLHCQKRELDSGRLHGEGGVVRSINSLNSVKRCVKPMSSALAVLLQTLLANLARIVATASNGLTPVRIRRVTVLAMYLTMNLGLPSGFGLRPAAGSTANACRCSAESRAAGRCCCNNLAMTTAKKKCCASRSEPEPKRCCATKHSVAKADEDQTAAWTGGCPCSTNDLPPMLLCPQPRILAGESSLVVLLQSTDRLIAVAAVPCGDRSRPSVPPPELAAS